MTKMRFMATFRVPWPALHWEVLPFLAGSGVEALGSLACLCPRFTRVAAFARSYLLLGLLHKLPMNSWNMPVA